MVRFRVLKPLTQPFMILCLPPSGTFKERTFPITGTNTGLFRTRVSQTFCLPGIHCDPWGSKSCQRADAKSDIERNTGRTGVVQVWEVDLDRFPGVKAFAAQAKGSPSLGYCDYEYRASRWRIAHKYQ